MQHTVSHILLLNLLYTNCPLWYVPGELLVVLQNQCDEDGGGQADVDGAPALIIMVFLKKILVVFCGMRI